MATITLPGSDVLDALRVPDGGFSIDLTTGEHVNSGYAVAIHPDRERVIPIEDVTMASLISYALENMDLLAEPGHVFGAWHDPETGKVYLDVSTVRLDRGEAMALARKHGQLAIFDFTSLSSVNVCR